MHSRKEVINRHGHARAVTNRTRDVSIKRNKSHSEKEVERQTDTFFNERRQKCRIESVNSNPPHRSRNLSNSLPRYPKQNHNDRSHLDIATKPIDQHRRSHRPGQRRVVIETKDDHEGSDVSGIEADDERSIVVSRRRPHYRARGYYKRWMRRASRSCYDDVDDARTTVCCCCYAEVRPQKCLQSVIHNKVGGHRIDSPVLREESYEEYLSRYRKLRETSNRIACEGNHKLSGGDSLASPLGWATVKYEGPILQDTLNSILFGQPHPRNYSTNNSRRTDYECEEGRCNNLRKTLPQSPKKMRDVTAVSQAPPLPPFHSNKMKNTEYKCYERRVYSPVKIRSQCQMKGLENSHTSRRIPPPLPPFDVDLSDDDFRKPERGGNEAENRNTKNTLHEKKISVNRGNSPRVRFSSESWIEQKTQQPRGRFVLNDEGVQRKTDSFYDESRKSLQRKFSREISKTPELNTNEVRSHPTIVHRIPKEKLSRLETVYDNPTRKTFVNSLTKNLDNNAEGTKDNVKASSQNKVMNLHKDLNGDSDEVCQLRPSKLTVQLFPCSWVKESEKENLLGKENGDDTLGVSTTEDNVFLQHKKINEEIVTYSRTKKSQNEKKPLFSSNEKTDMFLKHRNSPYEKKLDVVKNRSWTTKAGKISSKFDERLPSLQRVRDYHEERISMENQLIGKPSCQRDPRRRTDEKVREGDAKKRSKVTNAFKCEQHCEKKTSKDHRDLNRVSKRVLKTSRMSSHSDFYEEPKHARRPSRMTSYSNSIQDSNCVTKTNSSSSYITLNSHTRSRYDKWPSSEDQSQRQISSSQYMIEKSKRNPAEDLHRVIKLRRSKLSSSSNMECQNVHRTNKTNSMKLEYRHSSPEVRREDRDKVSQRRESCPALHCAIPSRERKLVLEEKKPVTKIDSRCYWQTVNQQEYVTPKHGSQGARSTWSHKHIYKPNNDRSGLVRKIIRDIEKPD